MAYEKPEFNQQPTGFFAAGCPEKAEEDLSLCRL